MSIGAGPRNCRRSRPSWRCQGRTSLRKCSPRFRRFARVYAIAKAGRLSDCPAAFGPALPRHLQHRGPHDRCFCDRLLPLHRGPRRLLAAATALAQSDPVVAKVNGAEIRESDLTPAEEDLGAAAAADGARRASSDYLITYVDRHDPGRRQGRRGQEARRQRRLQAQARLRAHQAADGGAAAERGQGRRHRRGHEEGL